METLIDCPGIITVDDDTEEPKLGVGAALGLIERHVDPSAGDSELLAEEAL